jgi:hypothetical protein
MRDTERRNHVTNILVTQLYVAYDEFQKIQIERMPEDTTPIKVLPVRIRCVKGNAIGIHECFLDRIQ